MAGSFTPGRDFKLDANDDLDLTTGDLQFTTARDAIAQSIKIRVMFFLGEWFRDINRGVPWLQEILGHKPSSERLYAIFRGVISDTFGVEEILQLEIILDAQTRELSVVWEVRTEYGLITDEAGF